MRFALPFAGRGDALRSRGVVGAPALGHWFSRDEAIMGTAIRVELWSTDRTHADAAMAAVMAEMHRIDAAMSPHKPQSELSRINRDAGAAPMVLSDEMFALLARSIDISELSAGAFDITFASVGQLYDYRAGVRPTPEALANACAAIGYRHLRLDRQTRTVHFGQPGMRIDLGGFAKGHAVDRSIALADMFMVLFLTANGIAQAVRERIAEFATLKTIGFSDTGVIALVFAEAALPCLLGAGLGVGLAAVISHVMPMFLPAGQGLPVPTMSVMVFVWAALSAAVVAFASSALPALRLRRMDIATALSGR